MPLFYKITEDEKAEVLEILGEDEMLLHDVSLQMGGSNAVNRMAAMRLLERRVALMPDGSAAVFVRKPE